MATKTIPEVKRHPHGGWTLAMPSSEGSSILTYFGNYSTPFIARSALRTWKRQHSAPRSVKGQTQLNFSVTDTYKAAA